MTNFRVGDRVRVIENDYNIMSIGSIGTISFVLYMGCAVKFTGNKEFYFPFRYLKPISNTMLFKRSRK